MIPFLPGEKELQERMTESEWLGTKLRFMGFQQEHPVTWMNGTLEKHAWVRKTECGK